MNAKPIRVFYDINRMEPVDLISTIHIDDKNTRYLELTLLDHGSLLVLQGCTVKARFVATDKALLSDNVPCTVTADNTILVPIDAAAVQSMACDLRIEINIVSGTDVLTLPFPLWVRVRGSILGNAHVSPDSEGTVPELLKEVEEELKRVQGFVTDDDVYEIMDGAFQGNSTVSPQFLIDSTVDQQYNPFGHLMVYYVDSNDVRHNLYDFYTTFVNMLKYRVVNSPDDATQIGVLYRTEISVDHDPQTVYVWCYENVSQFTQFAYLMNGHIAWRTKDKQTAWQPESDWGAWREIGGSEIASGVVNQNGTITFFDENGDPLFTTTGESVIGADGYSPTVSTTNLDAQTLVTVTDNNGAHNFYVKDGSSVTNAAVDENGDLIISIQQKPTSSVHPTIHTLEVNAGHVVGAAGADGYSPTVSTTNLDAQTLVTVTDNNGAHNFYVKDGSSVTNAAVDENGDLIISIQQKPTSSVHPTIHTLEVNAGHVVGADGAPGVSVTDATINQQGHLIITLSDGTTTDTGSVMFPKTDIANAVVTLSTSEFIYDGNQKFPTIRSVMLHGTALIKNQDYVVISPPETVIGDYLLIIQGIGDYVGTSSANWSIEAQERYIFGVMWDYSLSSPQLTRLTPQNDPLAIVTNAPSQEPTACVGNDGFGQSDFDNYMPWKGMRRYNYIDGQIVDFIGYQSGETFVYIPEFWSKIVNDTPNSKMYFYISSAEMNSFIKHPGSGRYMGRYACNENFLSASGFTPKVNTSLTAFRTGIAAIDNKHFQYDFSTYNAIELLYIVEFAHLNSQAKIGAGNTSGGVVQTTGQTDILTYHTGRVLGTDNLSAIQYRWVENLWGNVWNWVDGILIQNGLVYICEDPTKFYSSITNDYRNTGLITPSQGWLKTESDYANSYLIPLSTNGSDSTYLCDNCYYGSELRGLDVGGTHGTGSHAGLFCWSGSNPTEGIYATVGGRAVLILGGDQ